jgi:hypothetical protein
VDIDGAAFDAHVARRLLDIESRIVTLRATATSMVNGAKTEDDRAKAQQWLDSLDELRERFNEGP